MSGRESFESLAASAAAVPGVQVAELLAVVEGGSAAVVRDVRAATAPARRARTLVDLHGVHIGRHVLVLFEPGDDERAWILGVLRGASEPTAADAASAVHLDADGERLIVSARHQLVMRCGRASITLTKAGKVLIEGDYVLTRSTGVNRIKGGSVQIN